MNQPSHLNRRNFFLMPFLLLIVFPLIPPEGLNRLAPGFYSLVYYYGQVISFAVITFLFLFNGIASFGKSKDIFGKHSIIMPLVFVAAVFSLTIIYHGSMLYAFFSFMPCVATCMLAFLYRQKLNYLISAFLLVLELWIYINFFAMILYPAGMYFVSSSNSYQAWIFGYKSSFQYYILPALCLGWLNWKYRHQRVRITALLVACVYETVFSGNSMLLVGMAVMLALSVFDLSRFTKIFNIRTYMISVLAVNVVLVFMTAWFTRTTLGSMLLSFLGKNDTLSRRASLIWPVTLQMIVKSPLFGYGVYDSDNRVLVYGLNGAIHAHNQILEILFIGGAFLLIIYFLMFYRIIKKLNDNINLCSTKVLSASVFVMLLMVVVEVFTRRISAPVWMMIFLCEYCFDIECAYMQRYSERKRKKFKFLF